ncbi:MAG TPA: glycosyltransferase [Thermoanaerobaculia bacterium]
MMTIAIPTYNRGAILVRTLESLLSMRTSVDEILVVDQTREHPPAVEARLREWEAAGKVRVVRLGVPSIPHAMNVALDEARHERLLFLDDDSAPTPEGIEAHGRTLEEPGVWAVVGQVLQPGEEPEHFEEAVLRRGMLRDLEFRFNHDTACDVQNVIACNLSVIRSLALSIGGFDENYVAVAYRFETDFALRVVGAGGRVRFQPAASARHLKIPTGGVRAYGDHRTSASPAHSVGDYYFARRHAPRFGRYVLQRLRRNVVTRFHLTHPWTIPAKLIGETRGLLLALRLHRKGRAPGVVAPGAPS